jgi:phosphatidylethanolamine/phosphatidyl-N-methylethanolamine N-methyltransferase
MTQVTHDENAAFWRRFATWYDRFMVRANPNYDEIVDRIVEDAIPASLVLEVATGTGTIALAMSQKAGRVEAVDYAPEMIDVARSKAEHKHINNVRFSVQNACSLEFPDQHFDAVVCANVLHLLIDPGKALAEAHRVLKPHGILVAPTFCHGETPLALVLSNTMRIGGFKAFHKWTMDSFRRFVEGQRFEVVRDDVVQAPIPICYLIGHRI